MTDRGLPGIFPHFPSEIGQRHEDLHVPRVWPGAREAQCTLGEVERLSETSVVLDGGRPLFIQLTLVTWVNTWESVWLTNFTTLKLGKEVKALAMQDFTQIGSEFKLQCFFASSLFQFSNERLMPNCATKPRTARKIASQFAVIFAWL